MILLLLLFATAAAACCCRLLMESNVFNRPNKKDQNPECPDPAPASPDILLGI